METDEKEKDLITCIFSSISSVSIAELQSVCEVFSGGFAVTRPFMGPWGAHPSHKNQERILKGIQI